MEQFSEMFGSVMPADNPFFTGGIGLAVLGMGMAGLRRSWSMVGMMARRHLLMTLEVTSKDRSYPWVLNWVTQQSRQGGLQAVQHLSVDTVVTSAGPAQNTVFGLTPGPGRHLLKYRGKWIAIERARETTMLDLNSGRPWEKIQFMAFGRNTEVFSQLLSDAYEMARVEQEGRLVVYTNWGSEWRPFGQPRRRRDLTTVILDEGIKERVEADLKEWQRSREWYSQRGIPYRRGYLFHGSPGSGKTSFITAVAGWLEYNICVLNLSESGLTDDRLSLALSTVPERSLILLEDVDAAFVQREQSDAYGSNVTFSGLLNTLDGVASSEERLIFMTTNHLERLDPALIRPGRVDVVECLGNSTAYQRRELFTSFFKDTALDQQLDLHELSCDFESMVRQFKLEKKLSMAQLQGYFLLYKFEPRAAVQNVHRLFEEFDARSKTSETPTAPPTFRRRGRRRLSVDEIDRMPYNPQPGIEETLYNSSEGIPHKIT